MHYVEFPWILPTKKFVEEVIMQNALIGCENSEARSETVTWLIEGGVVGGRSRTAPASMSWLALGQFTNSTKICPKKFPPILKTVFKDRI